MRYGESVGKVPVDIGHVCPNRELGGCIYCRAESFTPGCLNAADSILIQVEKAKSRLLKGRFTKYFAYFQQETCTAAPVDRLLKLFRLLLVDENCVGLILSTRPDAVEEELLEPLSRLLEELGKDCLFEIGLQTVHEKSLRLLNRNHTFTDFTDCLKRLRRYPRFEVGVHLIFGIPGETEEEMLESVRVVTGLGVDALKLHHLQVIQDTPLEKMYRLGQVETFELDNYFELLLKVIAIIPVQVTIHRLWATAHPRLLVAPRWNVLAHLLSEQLRGMMRKKGLYQGKNLEI